MDVTDLVTETREDNLQYWEVNWMRNVLVLFWDHVPLTCQEQDSVLENASQQCELKREN